MQIWALTTLASQQAVRCLRAPSTQVWSQEKGGDPLCFSLVCQLQVWRLGHGSYEEIGLFPVTRSGMNNLGTELPYP